MKRVRFTYEYVPGPGPLLLTVVVGDGQVGGSAVSLDGAALAEPGPVEALPLGDGPALRGRELLVRTGVLDVNALSDRTSVTYVLAPRGATSGNPGAAPGRAFTATADVEHDGDAVLYETRIRFV
jgi:hypothetical protein